MRFSSGHAAKFRAEAFDGGGRGNHNSALPTCLNRQRSQIGEPIIFDGLGRQELRQLGGGLFAERTKPEPLLTFDGVTPAIPLGDEILVDRIRKHPDLFGDETDQRRGRPLTGAQSAAGIVEIAEHEPVAEAIGIAPAAQNRREVRCRQREVTDQLTLLDGRIEQLGDLRFAQSLPSRHSCLPTLASRRTIRSWPRRR